MSDVVPLPEAEDPAILPVLEAETAEPPPPRVEDPATMAELVEMLARTGAEEAAIDALAGNPSAQALEALRQHLRHEAAAAVAATPEDPKTA